MELTACLFDQVLRTLRTDINAREQRQHPRVGLRAKASIYPDRIGLTEIEPIQIWVRDLSLQGIGFTCPVGLPAGSAFELRLTARAGSALRARYTVVRSRLMGTVFLTGAELVEVIDPVEPDPLHPSRIAKPQLTLAALTKLVRGR